MITDNNTPMLEWLKPGKEAFWKSETLTYMLTLC